MLKQVVLLICFSLILSLPKTTYAVSPTASITGPTTGVVNQSYQFQTNASGENLSKMMIYTAKTNSDLIQAASWEKIAENLNCNGTTCSTEGSFTATVQGSYYIVVNVYDKISGACSGNPILLQRDVGEWKKCGDSSRLTFTAAPNPPTPIPTPTSTLTPYVSPSPISTPASTPIVTPTTSPEYTTFYRIAESPLDLNSAPEQSYTSEPLRLNYTFQDKTPGEKYLWVRFKTNKGNTRDFSLKVNLPSNPSPARTAAYSDYDTFILGNKLTRTLLDKDGRWAYYQTLNIVSNKVQFDSQAPWSKLDLDRLRGVGGERYIGYATFILDSNFYQTFIDSSGRFAYNRILPIVNNQISSGTNVPWQTLDLDNLRGLGKERYSGYAAYIIFNTYYQVFIDYEGRYAYSRKLNIVNNQIQSNTGTTWKQIDLDQLRKTSGGERYLGYSVYTINDHFVQTFISSDGTNSYTRVGNVTNDGGSNVQSLTNIAWLAQPLTNPINPTTLINTADYFTFKPGDYWIFSGTNASGTPYKVRVDVENTADTSLSYQGKSISAKTYPLRVTNDANTPTSQAGGFQDYTTFLTTDFNFQNQPIKWFIKTDFYEKNPVPVINKRKIKTAAFFPLTWDNPAYFVSRLNQDLAQRETHPFVTAQVNNNIFYDGDITSYAPFPTGWDTAYNLVNVNFPKYQGETLRIRFWEYSDPNQGLANSPGYNYDEWFFAKNIGLVGINNKIHRLGDGKDCANDADCSDQTTIMQSPMFTISLSDFYRFDDGESVSVQIAKDTSFANSVSINTGEKYKLKVTTKKNTGYTGFLKKEGNFVSSSGQQSAISRQILKTGIRPIWIENGIGSIPAGQEAGLLTTHYRPYIYNEKNIELGSNRLGWSNDVSAEIR